MNQDVGEGIGLPTVLITGASRGLGLEFARQYASDGWRVIATCRRADLPGELKEISGDINVREMDITDTDQVTEVANYFRGVAIDVLLNNAGITGPDDQSVTFGDLDITTWHAVMGVNAMAPLKVAEAFLDNVKASEQKTVVFVSSRASSISERGYLPHHQPGGSYIFRSSKAALNSAAKNLSFDLVPSGVKVLVLSPGWVKTDAGGPNAEIDPCTSVRGMRRQIADIPATAGQFRNYDGQVIPW